MLKKKCRRLHFVYQVNFVSLLGNENVPREHPWLSFSFLLPDGTPCFFQAYFPYCPLPDILHAPQQPYPQKCHAVLSVLNATRIFFVFRPFRLCNTRTFEQTLRQARHRTGLCLYMRSYCGLENAFTTFEGIRRDYQKCRRRRTNEKSFQGLLEWKRTRAHEATIRNLCTALWSIHYTEALEKLSSQGMI